MQDNFIFEKVLTQDSDQVWHAIHETNNGVQNKKNRIERLHLLNKELLNVNNTTAPHHHWRHPAEAAVMHETDEYVLCICGKKIKNFYILHDLQHGQHKICIGIDCINYFEEDDHDHDHDHENENDEKLSFRAQTKVCHCGETKVMTKPKCKTCYANDDFNAELAKNADADADGDMSICKLYLKVPFGEKNEAKQRGAKWDDENKHWYITRGQNVKLFTHWLPQYITIAYAEKEEAKGYGARWDPVRKQWYVLADVLRGHMAYFQDKIKLYDAYLFPPPLSP